MKELSSCELHLPGEVRRGVTDCSGAGVAAGYDSIMRFLVVLFLLIALPGIARPQSSSPSQGRPDQEPTLRIESDLVVLHATVHNQKGVLVSGLAKSDFQVYEDGVLQQIKSFSHDDIPVTVGLVIDNSGSMGPKRSHVIAAALAFARSSNPQDQMFVVNFNERVSFGLPDATPFTDQVPQLELALARVAANGETALYDAVAVALDHLNLGDRDKKVLIVISDGGDNASKHKLDQIIAMARKPGAIIYTIGLFDEADQDRNPKVLKQLAHETGGEAFLPGSIKEVVPICERIAHDVRNQYTITYDPTNKKQDGFYRRILVKAAARGHGQLLVRTRAGYYARSEAQPAPTE
ncbi:MAG: VWA domain-containing protein [Candidatus Angelobacter sp.]